MSENLLKSLQSNIDEAKALYSLKSYHDCIRVLEASLSDAASQGFSLLGELHLLLAKCYKGLDDVKNAILSCNSAIEHRPLWRDPHMYRSVCFQALYSSLTETDGDCDENIERDRSEADIIVDTDKCNTSDKLIVRSISEAITKAENGSKIFVEKGVYEVSSLFLCGKTVSLIGASTKDCVLEYKNGGNSSRLETFLICTVGAVPTVIKRISFRICSTSDMKTKFIGVAGGTVHLEDCVFDGGDESMEVGAVYSNAKICGNLASNFPPPRVIARFCVFERCFSYGAFTSLHSVGSLHCCYFVNCGRACIAALNSAKVSILNCELSLNGLTEQAIGATSSDLTVAGCHVYGSPENSSRGCYAIGISMKSVGSLVKNYINMTGNGVSCNDSDLKSSQNLVLNCTQRHSRPDDGSIPHSTVGLNAGFTLRRKSRVTLENNQIHRCDVAVYVGESATPAIKENEFGQSFFSTVFVENHSKPNIVGNTFNNGANELTTSQGTSGGLGILLLTESGGMIGKNTFENFDVPPLMIFSSCRPLIRDNFFSKVVIEEEKQKIFEKSMLEHFRAELFKSDEYFYVIDSETTERELQDILVRGHK